MKSAEWWDPVARVSAGPLSTRLAAERHRAGEQYAVLLAAGERPVGVVEVATGEAYIGARFFDGELAIASEADCRLLAPGRLFILEQRAGRTDPPPYDPGDKWLRRMTATPGGRVEEESRAEGGRHVRLWRQDPMDEYWMGAPEFGDWGAFIRSFPLALEAAGLDVPVSVEVRDVSAPDGAGLLVGERPWRAPRGLTPDPAYLGWLFTTGTRLSYDGTGWRWSEDEKFTVEVLDAGTLTMPSGRLVVKDPSWPAEVTPYTVNVSPGSFNGSEWLRELHLAGEVDYTVAFFHAPVTDPESGANLIAFHSGWGDGSYPVWIGRSADGQVACFVADMLLLSDGRHSPGLAGAHAGRFWR